MLQLSEGIIVIARIFLIIILSVNVHADTQKKYEIYLNEAKKGNPEAQYNLGIIYQFGKLGASVDKKEAIKWYFKAAKQGSAGAFFNLATMFINGDGVPKDDMKAFQYFLEAAKRNDGTAQSNIGDYYYFGDKPVEQSYSEAEKWYLLAIKNGYLNAANNMGNMYSDGRNGKVNKEKAIYYYELSANRIISDDFINYRKKKYKNSVTSQYNLGVIYEKTKDVKHAYNWYKKAAKNGHPKAQTKIGEYDHDNKSYIEARYWLLKGFNNGHIEAGLLLGNIYSSGHGVERNIDTAISYYKKASTLNNSIAINSQHNLGISYYEKKDIQSAIYWHKIAAENGHTESQYNLGILLNHIGRTEDAKYWINLAKNSGYSKAKDLLKKVDNPRNAIDAAYN